VALSEHEQQAIEQLEQALYRQDPAFVRRVHLENAFMYGRRRLALSVVGLAAGLSLMLAFCVTTSVVVGVAGFLIVFGSLDVLWTNTRRIGEARLDDLAPTEPKKGLANDVWHRLYDLFREDR
jgi:DUF3040 family protein